MSFMDVVRKDMRVVEVTEEDAEDRTERRWKISGGDPWREKPIEVVSYLIGSV